MRLPQTTEELEQAMDNTSTGYEAESVLLMTTLASSRIFTEFIDRSLVHMGTTDPKYLLQSIFVMSFLAGAHWQDKTEGKFPEITQ